jgi:hypothetical protein
MTIWCTETLKLISVLLKKVQRLTDFLPVRGKRTGLQTGEFVELRKAPICIPAQVPCQMGRSRIQTETFFHNYS